MCVHVCMCMFACDTGVSVTVETRVDVRCLPCVLSILCIEARSAIWIMSPVVLLVQLAILPWYPASLPQSTEIIGRCPHYLRSIQVRKIPPSPLGYVLFWMRSLQGEEVKPIYSLCILI